MVSVSVPVKRPCIDQYRTISIEILGIARRLVKAALQVAAKKREMRYSDLKKIDQGVRRHFHDNITVVVVFLDQASTNRNSPRSCTVSVKGGGR
ncbi:protein phosphatase 2C family protein [Actinidia rufa]|uniref:Protein phosphatase 2C family protein n=1 Tax=Actinidia rufa TaxID=165716 RepID=A0A7J0E8Y2_9ERIC|nr:protein phosphatase 2C family protein [Actinidia rufa]